MYEGCLTDAEIREVNKQVDSVSDSQIPPMTPDQMIQKAREGYFVRDAGRDLVYCPQGQVLRQRASQGLYSYSTS